ncbi:hypothetical protein [Marinicella sp. W31]|uniref:hypothetical protein n=1 Tax=Marinicella sp. W31 TaxID=3023713 RepID=UPI0037573878
MKLSMLLLLLMMTTMAISNELIDVTIKHNSENDSWRVTYQLPKPVTQMYFYRPGRLPRDQWHIEESNLDIKKEADGWQSINSTDGQMFDHFSINFASDYRHTPKDYELNFRFTDGSVVLYTGHLMLTSDQDDKPKHRITVVPGNKAHVIFDGQVFVEKYSWEDEELQGTYVYFGQIEPVKSQRMLAILDPGLPQWVLKRLNQDLPKLFDFYTEKTGLALDFIPVIYFSFKPNEAPGTQYSGGTLPGLIQFSIQGNDWQQQSESNLIGILHFLAHEAAHLWNSQMIENAGGHNSSWIHEGAADAFAVRAIQHLGVFNQNDILFEHEKYLNSCIQALNGHALMAFEAHGNFNAYYHCGSTIALLTEIAMQNKDQSSTVFTFWASIMERVNRLKQPLSAFQYLKSLLVLTSEDTLAVHIMTLLEEPQTDPIRFFSQMFEDVGLQLTPVAQHPRMARKAAEKAFSHLMELDCQGSRSYERRGLYFEVSEGLSCATLKAGMKINSIGGFKTVDAGHQVHQAVLENCEQNKKVPLITEDGAILNIVCTKKLVPQKPWLSMPKT